MVNVVATITGKAKEIGKTVISDVIRVAKSPAVNFIPAVGLMSSAKSAPVVVSKAPSVLSRLGSGAKTVWNAVTTPKMPTLKQFLGGTAFFVGAQKAFQAGRSGVSGEKFNPVPTKRELLRAGGAGFSPTFAVLGGTTGAIELFGKKTIEASKGGGQDLLDLMRKKTDLGMSKIEGGIDYAKDNIPSMPTFNFPSMPTTPTNVTLGMPSAPSVSTIMPSISVGGGGGGLDLAMLALLMGAGGGYLLGRKRKKKKYKKRKKR